MPNSSLTKELAGKVLSASETIMTYKPSIYPPGSYPRSADFKWKRLTETPLGNMVRVLTKSWDKVSGYANDNEAQDWIDHLFLAREVLCMGCPITRDDRLLIYRMAWKNRELLPPDLVLYAAIGGGVCGD